MFLSRKYSGLFSSTLSKYLSLCGAVVGGGEVTTAARVSPFIAQSFSAPQGANRGQRTGSQVRGRLPRVGSSSGSGSGSAPCPPGAP